VTISTAAVFFLTCWNVQYRSVAVCQWWLYSGPGRSLWTSGRATFQRAYTSIRVANNCPGSGEG